MPSRSTVLAQAMGHGSNALRAAICDWVPEQEVRLMQESMTSDHLTELELRHRQLHEEVHELERKAFLTPDEQRRIVDLKKQKLLAKDRLYAARRAVVQSS